MKPGLFPEGPQADSKQSVAGAQIGRQHIDDALGCRRGLFLTLLIQHRDAPASTLGAQLDAEWCGFGGVTAAEDAANDVLLLDLLASIRIQIADEELTSRTVTIFNRETGGVDGYANTTPCTVKGLVQHQLGLIALVRSLDLNASRIFGGIGHLVTCGFNIR